MRNLRTRDEVMALIEENQAAYVDGWLQPDQFAYNMAALSAELDALDSESVVRDPESWQAVAAAGRKYA